MGGFIETYRGMVMAWHCDHQGHMNTVQFHGMFDQAGWHMIARSGLTRERLHRERRGFVDIRMELAYLGEMLAGTPVLIESGVTKVGTTSLTYHSRMSNVDTGEVTATATCTTVYFDLDKRQKEPLPADLRAAFETLKVDPPR